MQQPEKERDMETQFKPFSRRTDRTLIHKAAVNRIKSCLFIQEARDYKSRAEKLAIQKKTQVCEEGRKTGTKEGKVLAFCVLPRRSKRISATSPHEREKDHKRKKKNQCFCFVMWDVSACVLTFEELCSKRVDLSRKLLKKHEGELRWQKEACTSSSCQQRKIWRRQPGAAVCFSSLIPPYQTNQNKLSSWHAMSNIWLGIIESAFTWLSCVW